MNQYVEINDYKPPFRVPKSTKFYRSMYFTCKMHDLLNTCSNSRKKCITFKDILHDIPQNCFVVGGAVRDLMHDIIPRDIDIKFKRMKRSNIQTICKNNQLACPSIKLSKHNGSYVKFIDDSHNDISLEGMELNSSYNIYDFENNVNALMYDLHKHVIIDFYGTGIRDNLQHTFALPPDLSKWLCKNDCSSKWRACVRVFKMIGKDYSLSNSDKTKFIHFFMDNLKNLLAPIQENISLSVIQYILLVTVRGDKYDLSNGKLLSKGNNKQIYNALLRKLKLFDKTIYEIILSQVN